MVISANNRPGYGFYQRALDYQIGEGYPVRFYCNTCFWSKAAVGSGFCPYGHGKDRPIEEYFEELTHGV